MRDCIVKSLIILLANVVLLCVAAYAGLTGIDRARAPANVRTTNLEAPTDRLLAAESRHGNAWPTANCDSRVLVDALGANSHASGKSRRCSLRSLTTMTGDWQIAEAGEGSGRPGGAFDRACVIESLRGEYLSSSRFAEPVFVEGSPARVGWNEVGSSEGE
jgi:hypothetical protein